LALSAPYAAAARAQICAEVGNEAAAKVVAGLVDALPKPADFEIRCGVSACTATLKIGDQVYYSAKDLPKAEVIVCYRKQTVADRPETVAECSTHLTGKYIYIIHESLKLEETIGYVYSGDRNFDSPVCLAEEMPQIVPDKELVPVTRDYFMQNGRLTVMAY
jgi:hypothetical protein